MLSNRQGAHAGVPSTSGRTPHRLELVIHYVNTLDLQTQADELAAPERLAAWLLGRGLLAAEGAPPSASEHAAAVRLREALRALMLEHNGGQPADRAVDVLEHAARAGELGVRFRARELVSIAPGSGDFAGALAQLLVPVALAMGDGSWQRVKACRAADCRWAFYDRSRNRAGVWCEMAACGNRSKVRAYRQRVSPGLATGT